MHPSATLNLDRHEPKRIISIHPAATEIILELGGQESLVGVSDFCQYPIYGPPIARVGGLVNPNLEQISLLEPDLIIISGKSETLANYCTLKGIPQLELTMEGISGILAGIEQLGRVLDTPEQAERLCTRIQYKLKMIRNRVADKPRVRVFLSLYRSAGSLSGITTVGPDTYLHELIELAGGQNIFSDVEQLYPQISKESLMRRQPDIIIEPRNQKELTFAARRQLNADWQWLHCGAVQNKRIYFPDEDLLLKPGPRVVEAAQVLADLIHPEDEGD
jgi:iron complex transport system substrate-binding protein